MAALVGGCVSSAGSSDYLLGLMSNVTSDRWGLGAAGVPALWKGGWGPGTDGRYLLRQMGALTVRGRQIVVTIAVRPDDGQYLTGQAVASEVARWVASYALRFSKPASGC
jgi:hypothetical protein